MSGAILALTVGFVLMAFALLTTGRALLNHTRHGGHYRRSHRDETPPGRNLNSHLRSRS